MVIFNLLGLLFAVIAGAAGAAAYWVSDSPRALFLATGAAACAVDLFYRRKQAPLSRYWLIAPHHGGHFFFVPVCGLGLVVAAVGLIPTNARAERNSRDPRWARLKADETALSSEKIGSDDFTKSIHKSLATILAQVEPGRVGVLTRIDEAEKKVLVLVRMDALRQLDEEVRNALLSLLERHAQKHDPGKDIYIGVKGIVSFGIVKTPRTRTVKTDSGAALLDFYGPPPELQKAK